MAQPKDDEPWNDLPRGIGNPAFRAFRAAGYTRLDQFTTAKEADLLRLHGVGPKAIGVIRNALEARGQSFADPDNG